MSAASVGFILCLMPQLWKTLQSRRADDLSWGFLALVMVSSALALPYAVHAREVLLACSWGVNLFVWGIVAYFKARPGPRPQAQR